MNVNKTIACALFGLVVSVYAADQQTARESVPRLKWFRDAKFGMFIHWGLYSVLGGEWNGRQMPARGELGFVDSNVEMIQEGLRIPRAEYRRVAREFNPAGFDAASWAALAKAAGMNYLVITAKHQDGFAMFRSAASKYNIYDATPFKRDPLKELSEACRKVGIRFCVYYSHRDDYDDPNSYGNYWEGPSTRNFEKYLDGKVLPQLRELLTGYGPLGLIWFDHGIYTPEQAVRIVDLVHKLQPACLVNGRVGNYGQELVGDYQSLTDHGLPPGGMQEYFEVLQTVNDSWGYSRFDKNWKPAPVLVRQLVDAVSKGGNYLLDVGPTGAGLIPQPAVSILREMGQWLRVNGESIYGASASPFLQLPWGRCTVKGEKLYVHIFDWPRDSVLALPGLKNEVRRAYLLAGKDRRVDFSRDRDGVTLRLRGEPVDKIDTVVVLEIAGRPDVAPPIVSQKDTATPIRLDYALAVTGGKATKRFNRLGGYLISLWSRPEDTVSWIVDIKQPHRYQVWITYAAQREWEGGRYQISFGSNSLRGEVVDTGAFCMQAAGRPCDAPFQYRAINAGLIDLPRAGEFKVTIRPAANLGHDMMYFRSIDLVPQR